MKTSTVTLIGVYVVPGEENTYLIELAIKQSPALIDIGSILQKDDGKNKRDWQTAYDERYLDENGETIIGDFFNHKTLSGDTTRVVFFMYLESLDKPLSTPYGDIPLGNATEIPARLATIDYSPMD